MHCACLRAGRSECNLVNERIEFITTFNSKRRWWKTRSDHPGPRQNQIVERGRGWMTTEDRKSLAPLRAMKRDNISESSPDPLSLFRSQLVPGPHTTEPDGAIKTAGKILAAAVRFSLFQEFHPYLAVSQPDISSNLRLL